MEGLPGVATKKGFFQKKWTPDLFEVVGGLVALVPVGLQAWNNLNETSSRISPSEKNLSYIAFAGIIIVCVKGALSSFKT